MAERSACHTLQRVLLPRPGLPAGLYLNGNLPEGDEAAPLILPAGARFSTESYFNSFYLSYWCAFTAIGRVGIRLALSGHVRVTMRLAGRTAVEREVRATEVASETVLWLDETQEAGAGRLHVEIEMLAESRLGDISYVTDRAPLHDVTLSVGICTFNRESHLIETVKELLAAADRNQAIGPVHVVNQGPPFAMRELRDLFSDMRLNLVEQANLGGCGGFNRTMHEALVAKPASTHHLLMDDDVALDGRIIDTAIGFLRYASKDFVLGGQMLDAGRRSVLYEAGAVFDPFWFIRSLGKGIDLSEPSSLALFDRETCVDYNAWWFCIMPVHQIAAAQFSPPIFIRGDDIEYGCRLAKRGVPTVALPGVAVWHELFFSSDGEWQQYYDIRNRLILSCVHGDLTAPPGTHVVFGYVLECLLTHRYSAARMCIAGISDFLLGPDRLFTVSPEERHRAVRALRGTAHQTEISAEEAGGLAWGPVIERPGSVRAAASIYLRRFLAIVFLPYDTRNPRLFQYDDVNPMAVGNAAFVMTDSRGHVFVRHVPSRLRVLVLLLRAMVVVARFQLKRRKVSADWTANIARYQTLEAWKSLFEAAKPTL